MDFFDRWIESEPGTTKNRDGRKVKMTADIFELVKACAVGKAKDDYLFTRENGDAVHDFRDDWYTLCVTSNLGQYVLAEASERGRVSALCGTHTA